MRNGVENDGFVELVDRSQHTAEAKLVGSGSQVEIERSDAPIEIERNARGNKQHVARFSPGGADAAWCGIEVRDVVCACVHVCMWVLLSNGRGDVPSTSGVVLCCV